MLPESRSYVFRVFSLAAIHRLILFIHVPCPWIPSVNCCLLFGDLLVRASWHMFSAGYAMLCTEMVDFFSVTITSHPVVSNWPNKQWTQKLKLNMGTRTWWKVLKKTQRRKAWKPTGSLRNTTAPRQLWTIDEARLRFFQFSASELDVTFRLSVGWRQPMGDLSLPGIDGDSWRKSRSNGVNTGWEIAIQRINSGAFSNSVPANWM